MNFSLKLVELYYAKINLATFILNKTQLDFYGGIMSEEYDFTGLYEGECGYFQGRLNHEEIYAMPDSDEEYENIVGKCEFPALRCFDFFLEEGFRRSGPYIYRATCPDCKKCVPIRIRVENFSFSKNQRHLLKKNSDIVLSISNSRSEMISDEKINLMMMYQKRHDEKSGQSFESTREMLISMNGLEGDDCVLASPSYPGTINMDYRLNGKLIGVGVIDLGNSSLSSNYFYYDISPEIMKRSIGTFTILKEIEFCKENGIPFYYLGYYLSECKSMVYKGRLLPHELLIDGEWIEQKEQNFDV